MAWPEPEYTKSKIRAAGKRIAHSYVKNGRVDWGGDVPLEDFNVLENWRASHGAVLNTAQAWLRRLDKVNSPVVGQRLKRHTTVIDKLGTGRSKDLYTMHDIAGVRAIFRTNDDLINFRGQMRKSRAAHRIIHEHEKYDYISNPKPTGYRGVHDVVERNVESRGGQAWNGLKFEVQLRTAVQHAWATAIEIFDVTQSSRFKFLKDDGPAYRQFLIASELFARVHEGMRGCLHDKSDIDLFNEFFELEAETQAITVISGLQRASKNSKLNKNSVLQITINGDLVVHNFPSLPVALKSISEIEGSSETLNAVLVGSSTPNHIRAAFVNYFEDTTEFVALLRRALKSISPQVFHLRWYR